MKQHSKSPIGAAPYFLHRVLYYTLVENIRDCSIKGSVLYEPIIGLWLSMAASQMQGVPLYTYPKLIEIPRNIVLPINGACLPKLLKWAESFKSKEFSQLYTISY